MRALVTLAAGLLLAACGDSADDAVPTASAGVPAGHEYVIGYGETLRVEGGLVLEFTTLVEDSRCPSGVTCVWEGNARILLAAQTGQSAGVLELNTSAQFPTRSVFDSYTIELRKLEPYPSADPQNGAVSIPVSGYQATIFVDRVVYHAASQGP